MKADLLRLIRPVSVQFGPPAQDVDPSARIDFNVQVSSTRSGLAVASLAHRRPHVQMYSLAPSGRFEPSDFDGVRRRLEQSGFFSGDGAAVFRSG